MEPTGHHPAAQGPCPDPEAYLTALEETTVRLSDFLDKHQVAYMVIGGIANLFWGHPRTTLDVDVTVWVDEGAIPTLVSQAVTHFQPRVEHPQDFVKETRVLPLRDRNSIPIDLIFGSLPYEERAIRRARLKPVGSRMVRVCAPEDLIIHKIVSDRARDKEDVRSIISRQGPGLDRSYLDPLIEELSEVLKRPEILNLYRQCLKG